MEPRTILLTGGPAVGKNTVGELVAAARERCALIDVDDVRQMIRNPHAAPWEGSSGSRQQRLGVLNACSLAASFVRNHYDAVVLDVLTDETAALYRGQLHGVSPLIIVHLAVSRHEARRRSATRLVSLTDDEFELLHDQQASLTTADVVFDTTAMTAEAVAEQVIRTIESS